MAGETKKLPALVSKSGSSWYQQQEWVILDSSFLGRGNTFSVIQLWWRWRLFGRSRSDCDGVSSRTTAGVDMNSSSGVRAASDFQVFLCRICTSSLSLFPSCMSCLFKNTFVTNLYIKSPQSEIPRVIIPSWLDPGWYWITGMSLGFEPNLTCVLVSLPPPSAQSTWVILSAASASAFVQMTPKLRFFSPHLRSIPVYFMPPGYPGTSNSTQNWT